VKKEKGQVIDRNDSFIGRPRGKSYAILGSSKDLGRIRNQSVIPLILRYILIYKRLNTV